MNASKASPLLKHTVSASLSCPITSPQLGNGYFTIQPQLFVSHSLTDFHFQFETIGVPLFQADNNPEFPPICGRLNDAALTDQCCPAYCVFSEQALVPKQSVPAVAILRALLIVCVQIETSRFQRWCLHCFTLSFIFTAVSR